MSNKALTVVCATTLHLIVFAGGWVLGTYILKRNTEPRWNTEPEVIKPVETETKPVPSKGSPFKPLPHPPL